MIRFKAAVASAALIAATGLAFAQESTPAPQAPAAQQNQADCPAPGSVPEADLPANCKMSSTTTEQPKTDSDTATTTPAPAQQDEGTTATTTPLDSQSQQPATGTAAAPQPVNPNAFLASSLIGQTVYSSANENVGEINDLVIKKDLQSSSDQQGAMKSPIMAVVGVGGFLGIGEKDVAVPMEDIQISKDANNNTVLVINLSRQQLEASPAFDRTAALGAN
jgi:hypothetical protein